MDNECTFHIHNDELGTFSVGWKTKTHWAVSELQSANRRTFNNIFASYHWPYHAHIDASNQNSKSATIEMYAPSSYNDTVTGETLSSVSEKSDSYSNEGSQPDYMVSDPN